MERAAKAVRRSGVKLLSLGGGHGDLNMVISEQKDLKNTAKAFMAAQNSGKMKYHPAAQYMMKWASNEENRAIEDVSNQIVELNLIWTEAQREFAEQLKDFKHMFDLILEGEKHVDQAKNNLLACEQRETKIKKELKKAAKKASAEELRQLESRLIQAERQKDLAQLEVEDKIRENEAVKLIRFKEGMMKISGAYTELGRKCAIIFEAQKNISHQLPDVYEKDLEDIKYTGTGTTKHYVLQAKEKVRKYKRQSQLHQTSVPFSNLAEPPPPYTPGDFYDGNQSNVGAHHNLLPEEVIDPHLHSNVTNVINPAFNSTPQPTHRTSTSLPARTITPPRLQQQLPAQQQHSVGGRSHDAAVEDLNWGSEDEGDLTGAMGGLNL